MQPAERLRNLPPYVFARLGKRIRKLQAEGRDIIRLDIGAPDMPPADFIIDALNRSARDPKKHSYAGYVGTPALRKAIADYYGRRFGVEIDPDTEALPLIGSKEGIANMALAYLDPGDLALVPDPGYPTYTMGARLAGAETYPMPLLAENGFMPDLDTIPDDVADRARLMWISYPNNPTGAVATMEFFEKAVDFARKHDIMLCHDAPYAEVTYDGYEAPSLLQVPGSKEVAVEFNSLSKAYNMAGWRVGMIVGNSQGVQSLLQVKSNIDSGIFLPIQDAAVVALTGDQSWLKERNAIYQERRDMILATLKEIGMAAPTPKATLYIWPRVPDGYTSEELADEWLLDLGVSVTPGSAFGKHGEGYVRISVGQDTGRIREALERLRGWKPKKR